MAHRLPAMGAGLGLGGLVFLFLLGLRSPTGFYLGMFLCLTGLLVALPGSIAVLARRPLFWIALILFVGVYVRSWLGPPALERELATDPELIWQHARYALLVPLLCGFWLATWWRWRYILLLLCSVGIGIFLFAHWHKFASMVPGGQDSRWSGYPEGGLIIATMFFLVAAAAVAALAGRLGQGPWRRWLLGGAAGLVALVVLAALVFTLARASWVGFTVGVGIVAATAAFRALRYGGRRERRVTLAGIGGCALAGILVVVLGWDIFTQRIAHDREMIDLALSGELSQQDVPEQGSFAVRYRILRQGLIDAGEHAWIGVGPASVRDMLHEIWGMQDYRTGNYHNTWLNFSVAMGLPWALLWAAAHLWGIGAAFRRLIDVYRDPVLAYGLLGGAAAHFATLTFVTRFWSVEASALYVLLMTLVCGVLLRDHVATDASAAEDNRSASGVTPRQA